MSRVVLEHVLDEEAGVYRVVHAEAQEVEVQMTDPETGRPVTQCRTGTCDGSGTVPDEQRFQEHKDRRAERTEALKDARRHVRELEKDLKGSIAQEVRAGLEMERTAWEAEVTQAEAQLRDLEDVGDLRVQCPDCAQAGGPAPILEVAVIYDDVQDVVFNASDERWFRNGKRRPAAQVAAEQREIVRVERERVQRLAADEAARRAAAQRSLTDGPVDL